MVASFTVFPAREGTTTSRVLSATRMEAAAKSTYVRSRAPPSRSSFPALHTRVFRAMNQ